jgi:hypothetical protein
LVRLGSCGTWFGFYEWEIARSLDLILNFLNCAHGILMSMEEVIEMIFVVTYVWAMLAK